MRNAFSACLLLACGAALAPGCTCSEVTVAPSAQPLTAPWSDSFDRAVARYNIRWTMTPAGDLPLLKLLDSSRNWRRIHADRVGVIHVRIG